ncbi:MAG TPA: nuclear transport factor 2 family protein [Gaiellaceae bacterium]
MSELMREHVARFNAAVESGDWAPMLEQFADDAELEFRGLPVGPFSGRDAIAAAYADQPPDDMVRLLEERERERSRRGSLCVARRAGRCRGRDAADAERRTDRPTRCHLRPGRGVGLTGPRRPYLPLRSISSILYSSGSLTKQIREPPSRTR